MNNLSIQKQFWRYAIPTVAAMLVNGLYQVVDGIFIGQFMGASGLAGINVAWPVIGSILGLGMMIGVGTGALASIRLGEEDRDAAKQILATGMMTLALCAPIVAILLWQFSHQFLAWQGVDGEIYAMGMQYLDVLIFGAVFTLGSIATPFLIRNDDSPNIATALMVLGAVVNIVLDYLFIAVFDWQLAGAALATLIAQGVVTVLGIGYFFSRYAKMRLSVSDFRFRLTVLPRIMAIGLASFFMYAYGSIMVAVHNALFATYGDMVLIGSYAILGYIVAFYYLIAEGLANAMQPLVSFNYGARKQQNIKHLFNITIVSAVGIGVLFLVLLNLFPYHTVSIFNSTDTSLIDNTVLGIRLHLFALFLDGMIVVIAAYYQAIGYTKKALFVTVGNIAIQLPFLYVLPKLWGVTGVWIAYPISNIVLGVVVAMMIIRDLKRLLPSHPKPAM
ncbi:MATE family efflux transporter [Vibrio hippocampi]|uniref:Multidrug export protein MepA n=1 Tax=Vibrio hippocampi TaxID=654686 RepID=A0ABM8ZK21_9VIBR|nr:MATE family efflux transporter [Vibrio hippocampi]CAH0526765.1 Multidrug export protein MepA [Vibrio hippocampi]